VTTKSERHFTLAGYVDTSHGRVETTVAQTLSFSNRQDFVVGDTQYVQNIQQGTRILSGTETKNGHSIVLSGTQLSYPLTLEITQIVNADGSFSQTTNSDQTFDSREIHAGQGIPSLSSVSNTVQSKDTLLFSAAGAVTGFRDRDSSQSYVSRDVPGTCTSRSITAHDGLLTGVTDGDGCGH